MKRLFLLTLFFVGFSILSAQTVEVNAYGVSPRAADSSEVDIFDRAFNGLLNVGVETQMYLVGSADATLTGVSWSVDTAPGGSVAEITVTTDLDTSHQVAVFTPDVTGTYVVTFNANGMSASATINAGLYLGNGGGTPCATCHSGKVDDWEGTGHADALDRGLDGLKGDHFASYCVSCHSTGNDPNAANDGFDDFPFVFPDTLFAGIADSMYATYPDAMGRANIQCESCHGPGSAHNANVTDSRMVSSLSTKVCESCHNAGTHHVYPDQWDISGHANPPERETWSASCARCHTAAGFIQYADGDPVESQAGIGTVGISCAACHDPHAHNNEHQVRTTEATLANDEVVSVGGLGVLCMNCHQSRREANSYSTTGSGSHFGPHYMPQADMLLGTNVVTFGKTLPTSPHAEAVANTCVDCHMASTHETASDSLSGGHTFNVVSAAGVDNVAICADCHGDVGTTFAEKPYYYNGEGDHDGDGDVEGLQEEVTGLMETLAGMLPAAEGHDAYDAHDAVTSTFTLTEKKAAYNYEMVYYDHSHGVHNPAFTVALLKVSIQALENNAIDGEIVAIDDVPNDFGKQLAIVWDAFVDDGLALDPVATYIIKRDDGNEGVWTTVAEVTADGSDRYAAVVPTLGDAAVGDTTVTSLMVVSLSQGGVTHESLPGTGISVKNLVPLAPENLIALASNFDVDISWMAPAIRDDKDQINFYRVYRSLIEDFEPTSELEIGTTTELSFADVVSETGRFYYKVAGVDFQGNEGEFTEAGVNIVSGLEDGNIPHEFALSQNYPNPFNPTTQIDFTLKQNGKVQLTVFNPIGQVISTLVNGDLTTGFHSTNFNASGLASGVYFYKITVTVENTVAFQAINKMVIMK